MHRASHGACVFLSSSSNDFGSGDAPYLLNVATGMLDVVVDSVHDVGNGATDGVAKGVDESVVDSWGCRKRLGRGGGPLSDLEYESQLELESDSELELELGSGSESESKLEWESELGKLQPAEVPHSEQNHASFGGKCFVPLIFGFLF